MEMGWKNPKLLLLFHPTQSTQNNQAGYEPDKNFPMSNELNPAICYQESENNLQHKTEFIWFHLPDPNY